MLQLQFREALMNIMFTYPANEYLNQSKPTLPHVHTGAASTHSTQNIMTACCHYLKWKQKGRIERAGVMSSVIGAPAENTPTHKHVDSQIKSVQMSSACLQMTKPLVLISHVGGKKGKELGGKESI